jgi:hypothetical protein
MSEPYLSCSHQDYHCIKGPGMPRCILRTFFVGVGINSYLPAHAGLFASLAPTCCLSPIRDSTTERRSLCCTGRGAVATVVTPLTLLPTRTVQGACHWRFFARPEMLGSVLRLGGKFHTVQYPGKTKHYLTLAHSDRRRLGYTEDTKSGAQGATSLGNLRDMHGHMIIHARDLLVVYLPDIWS